MPRKRKDDIVESPEELLRLEEQYRGKPEAARTRVLRLLKENASLQIDEAAAQVGYSKQAVKRWLKMYREHGLETLLKGAQIRRQEALKADDLEELRRKLLSGELKSLAQVGQWLNQAGEEMSENSVNSETQSSSRVSTEEVAVDGRQVIHISAERVLTFLDSLPVTHDVQEWIEAVRNGLQSLLSDVNRISITVNAQCDLLNPEAYRPGTVVFQNLDAGQKTVGPVPEALVDNSDTNARRLFDIMRRQDFPFDKYHPPITYTYLFGGHAYLGSVVLWRDINRTPISGETLTFMNRIQNFMVFILSDFVARHRYAKPIDSVFSVAMEDLINKVGLTAQERRIVILQSLGLSYDEMADTLNISINTLRYHLRSVYTKAGARSQTELFAKYFTPRLDPHKSTP